MIVFFHLAVVLAIVAIVVSGGLFLWAALSIFVRIVEGINRRRDGIS